MARKPLRSQLQEFARLIAEYEPEVREAFMDAVEDLQDGVDWKNLISALQRGDVQAAVEALNIHPAAWSEYANTINSTYSASGSLSASQVRFIEGSFVGVRFDMRNPRAQQWIAQNVGEKIVGFAEEQVQIARTIIELGYSKGEGPRTIATDLVGRVGPSGSREGGVLGLDSQRARRLHIVSVAMRTPEGVRSLYEGGRLKYKVNKATALRLKKAYEAGEAVPKRDIELSINQYRNALLKDRADTVAETETGNAVMSSRQESWLQAAESQGLDGSAVVKTWRHRRGSSPDHRPDHLAMNGISVVGLGTPFVFPDGVRMQHAHDSNGGARHIIRCGCDTEYRLRRRR